MSDKSTYEELEQRVKDLEDETVERKRLEETLQKSEKKYRNIIENLQDVYYQTNLDGIIEEVSPSVEYYTGYSAAELIGKKVELLYQDIKDRERILSKIIRNEKVWGYELLFKKKNGECLNVSVNAVLSYNEDGVPIGMTGTVRDMTEKQKLEAQLQQAQKMESIGTLSSGIAHDFNNILGIIIGNTELAMDDVPEWNPVYSNLEEIKTASMHARGVIKQLLSFSRKTTQERKPIQIIPIIEDSLKFLRSTIPTSIDISHSIQATDDTILADSTQIHQVMMNLCTNASHAMETGGTIKVGMENIVLDEDSATLYSDLIPNNYVRLTVSDTGQGIDPEAIDRIFNPYYTTKEVGKGTGMGLSMVHGIVKSHEGAISVDSELGKGTTFSLFLPVIEKQADSEIATAEELPAGNELILFVDDEKSLVYIGRYRLERLGYQVETQTSPAQALKLFQANPDQFDLVITDMTMPQMTGDKLIKEILKIRPDMPTILCTGFHKKIDKERSKELGISAYIEKPVNKRDLAKLVRKVLDEK